MKMSEVPILVDLSQDAHNLVVGANPTLDKVRRAADTQFQQKMYLEQSNQHYTPSSSQSRSVAVNDKHEFVRKYVIESG